jgi:hypothetical protein
VPTLDILNDEVTSAGTTGVEEFAGRIVFVGNADVEVKLVCVTGTRLESELMEFDNVPNVDPLIVVDIELKADTELLLSMEAVLVGCDSGLSEIVTGSAVIVVTNGAELSDEIMVTVYCIEIVVVINVVIVEVVRSPVL